jgi:ribosomal protein S27E
MADDDRISVRVMLTDGSMYVRRVRPGDCLRIGRCPDCRDRLDIVVVGPAEDAAVCEVCGSVVGRIVWPA